MFGSLKPASPPPPQRTGARDALFGDIPLPRLLGMIRPEALSVEPWKTFQRAKISVDSGDAKAAIETLRRILETPQLESRLILQAWQTLRRLGETPPEPIAKQLLGVVVEVGMPKGLDLLAAYADYHARYCNFSGAGIVWERPNDTLDESIDEVLARGSAVVRMIGPWQGVRPPAPVEGQARINLLTPSGLHFGEGPMDILSKDPMGGAVLASAIRLMQRLIELSGKGPAEPAK
ncbi:MAG TPA: hypothetical protein VMD55_10440 [Terracidiphilus sp.]|nr:hypothetical protein [Terracidiphilus sp.]